MDMLQAKQQEETKRLREQMEAEVKAERHQLDNMSKASMEHAEIMQENQWRVLETKPNKEWQQRMETLKQQLQQVERNQLECKNPNPKPGFLDKCSVM